MPHREKSLSQRLHTASTTEEGNSPLSFRGSHNAPLPPLKGEGDRLRWRGFSLLISLLREGALFLPPYIKTPPLARRETLLYDLVSNWELQERQLICTFPNPRGTRMG